MTIGANCRSASTTGRSTRRRPRAPGSDRSSRATATTRALVRFISCAMARRFVGFSRGSFDFCRRMAAVQRAEEPGLQHQGGPRHAAQGRRGGRGIAVHVGDQHQNKNKYSVQTDVTDEHQLTKLLPRNFYASVWTAWKPHQLQIYLRVSPCYPS